MSSVFGEGVLGTESLGDDGNSIRFAGRGYKSQLNPPEISFGGRGYTYSLQTTFEVGYGIQFIGRGYSVSPEMLGGFIFTGQGYSATPSFAFAPDYNIFFTGTGYAAELEATLDASTPISFMGRGYSYSPELLGGFILEGRGFINGLSSSVITSDRTSFVGRGYVAGLEATATVSESISFIGRGFEASLWQQGFAGRGYAVTPLFTFEFDADYAQAFVMNLNTNEVTRYTNYPFIHVARVGNEEYGFALDGIYHLSGAMNGEEPVNGQITTKDTDFNTQDFDGFQSKNVPLLYANTDATIKVTAIVDGISLPIQTSQFNGRKTKLSRGARGRYWAMKVENITKLQGLEFLPEKLQRRVK